MKRLFSLFAIFVASLFGSEAATFQLLTLPAPITYQGATFSAVTVRMQDGSVPTQAAGYVFRPVRVISAVPAVAATETTPAVPEVPAQPERVEEIGGEYFCADPAPSLAGAPAAIAAHCAKPPPAPEPPVYRVLKDTIVLRVKEAGKLTQLRQVITSLTEDQRFEWDNASWFSSTNPLIVQGVQSIGLDPAIILARDPLAP